MKDMLIKWGSSETEMGNLDEMCAVDAAFVDVVVASLLDVAPPALT